MQNFRLIKFVPWCKGFAAVGVVLTLLFASFAYAEETTLGDWRVISAPAPSFDNAYEVAGVEILFQATSQMVYSTGQESRYESFSIACSKQKGSSNWEVQILGPLDSRESLVLTFDGKAEVVVNYSGGVVPRSDNLKLLAAMKRGSIMALDVKKASGSGFEKMTVSLKGVTAVLNQYVATCPASNISEIMDAVK